MRIPLILMCMVIGLLAASSLLAATILDLNWTYLVMPVVFGSIAAVEWARKR